MHDYDISWDYHVVNNPDRKVVKFVNAETKKIKKHLLPKLKCFTDFKVEFVQFDDGEQIAVYCDGTSEFPIVGIDIEAHKEAIKEYGGNLFSAIKTSILHELGHAIQEYRGKAYDESEAEDFAFYYEEFGVITEI